MGLGQVYAAIRQLFGANVNVTPAPTNGQSLVYSSANAAWQAGAATGATASALATSGASVNVSSAAPPTSTQVLTATDATHATWQTPATTSLNPTTSIVTIGDGLGAFQINGPGDNDLIVSAGSGNNLILSNATHSTTIAVSTGSIQTTGGFFRAQDFKCDVSKNVVCNASGAALAQSATDGFLHPPQCLTDAPNGTPASIYTGAVPCVFGGDNNLYAYYSATWNRVGGVAPTSIAGAANQITASASTGAVTLSLPAAITLPGSLTAGGTVTIGAQTLALASATITGTPTWSSSQAIVTSTAAQPNITSLGTLSSLATGTVTLSDAANVVVGTSTGTKIGTGTTQKLGFFNATPVVQEPGSNDVLASLVTLGLRAASSNPPLNLGSGAITAGNITGTLQTAAQANVTSLGSLTGLTVAGTIAFSGAQTLNGVAAATGTTVTVAGGAGTAGPGGLLTAAGGAGAGTDRNAGGLTLDTGASAGAGTGTLTFKVPQAQGSGTGSNASASFLTATGLAVTLSGLTGTTNSAAQTVGLTAGQGSASAAGATFTATAGAGGATTGAGGVASLVGGAGTNGNSAGGNSLLTGGAGQGSAAGGSALVTGGAAGATGAGGVMTAAGGAGVAGAGGLATVAGGAGLGTDKASGGLTLSTGASSGAAAPTAMTFSLAPAVSAGASGTGANAAVSALTLLGVQNNLASATFAAGALANLAVTFGDGGGAGTGSFCGLRVAPTLNYTNGTKAQNFTALLIQQTNTSAPTGTMNLIDAQLGGTSKFSVDSTGIVSAASTIASAANVQCTSAGSFKVNGRSLYRSQADGDFDVTNNAASSTTFAFTSNVVSKFGNVTCAGYGLAPIVAAANATAQSGANASIATYAGTAADGNYEIAATMNVTAATAATLTLTCAYTDVNNVGQTIVFPVQLSGGTGGTYLATGSIVQTGDYSTPTHTIRVKASTAITIKSTFSGTSVTYSASGIIKRTS